MCSDASIQGQRDGVLKDLWAQRMARISWSWSLRGHSFQPLEQLNTTQGHISMYTSSVMPDSLCEPSRRLCPWDFPSKNTGVDCHFLLQGTFLMPGLNLKSPSTGRFCTTEPPGNPRTYQSRYYFSLMWRWCHMLQSDCGFSLVTVKFISEVDFVWRCTFKIIWSVNLMPITIFVISTFSSQL